MEVSFKPAVLRLVKGPNHIITPHTVLVSDRSPGSMWFVKRSRPRDVLWLRSLTSVKFMSFSRYSTSLYYSLTATTYLNLTNKRKGNFSGNPQSGSSIHCFLINLKFRNVGFMEEIKTENTQKKPRSKDENQQQTQPTCDVNLGNRTQVTLVGSK